MPDVAAQLRDLVTRTDVGELPDVIAALAGAHALAFSRLLAPRAAAAEPTQQPPDGSQTAEDIAAALNTPVSFVYELARQGRIPVDKLGRYRRFSLAAVRAALAAEANAKRDRLEIRRQPKRDKGSARLLPPPLPQANCSRGAD